MKNIRLITGVLALLGAIGLPAAQADPFHASGSYVETALKGSIAQGTLAGHSAGGDFIGAFREKVIDGGAVLDGTAILDFGDGDTLTFDYLLIFDPQRGRYIGVWIITRGTGALRHATGGGDLAVTPNSGQPHLLWLSGDLSTN